MLVYFVLVFVRVMVMRIVIVMLAVIVYMVRMVVVIVLRIGREAVGLCLKELHEGQHLPVRIRIGI